MKTKTEETTPRTNAAQSAVIGFFSCSCATVPASFAARLEIELEETQLNSQHRQTELQSMLQVLVETERELGHWHDWQCQTNPTYVGSPGYQTTLRVLVAAREKIRQPYLT